MKKLLTILLSILLLVSFTGCTPKNPDEPTKTLLQQIQEKGYIVIGTEADWPPYTYYDENGKLTGFDVEVGKLIAEQLHVEARFEDAPWDALLAGLSAGRFDLVCNGVGYTQDRAEVYEMSNPYAYTDMVVIVKADNTTISTTDDLNGKKTANTAGSTYADALESFGATNVPIDTFADTILLLERGDIDATANSKGSFDDYMSEHPDAQIKIAFEIEGETLVYPVLKGETDLCNAINAALDALRANGKLAELSIQFFGEDITNK